jgi:hypothetical protein
VGWGGGQYFGTYKRTKKGMKEQARQRQTQIEYEEEEEETHDIRMIQTPKHLHLAPHTRLVPFYAFLSDHF